MASRAFEHNLHASDASIALNEPSGRKPALKPAPKNEPGYKATTKTPAAGTRTRQVKRPLEHDTVHETRKIQKLSHRNGHPGRAKAGVVEPNRRVTKPRAIINTVPGKRLSVYVCGTNEEGEMGLGAKGTATEYRRPRHNPTLETLGVVTRHNVGRWNGGMVDMENGANGRADGSNTEDSESGLNPREATPTPIDSSAFPKDTTFVQLAAGDNVTFALTDDGLVYGWGTFKSGDGGIGFSPSTKLQPRPVLIPSLRNITKLAVGSNHALALTGNGAVLAWGYGEQHQTGRRLLDRTKSNGLIPQGLGLSKGMIDIGTGGEHSFAVHENGVVYAWGLNNFAQAGIMEREGEDFSNILRPTPVKSLRGYGKVVRIGGGNHHSFAVTDKGECLTWGRCNAKSLIANIPPDKLIYDARGKARILTVPTQVPNFNSAVFAAAGSDQCLGVTREGNAYSWGYTINGETGQDAADDVEEATLIDHSSIRGKRIVWVGCGGHYSVLAEEVGAMTNGTH